MDLSATEENYLKAIYQVCEHTEKDAGTNDIARHLSTSAASVSDMLKKLADKELISYKKYRGVKLSELGYKIATLLIRKHRLWETFLVDKLGFSWGEVHGIAEQLEHVQSDKLVNKLDQYLGMPAYDPHGDPIPDSQGKIKERLQIKLSDIAPNTEAQVVHVLNDEESFLGFLDQIKIKIGTIIKVVGKIPFDNSLQVMVENQNIILTQVISDLIMVKKINN